MRSAMLQLLNMFALHTHNRFVPRVLVQLPLQLGNIIFDVLRATETQASEVVLEAVAVDSLSRPFCYSLLGLYGDQDIPQHTRAAGWA
jgi:hypothetical protein